MSSGFLGSVRQRMSLVCWCVIALCPVLVSCDGGDNNENLSPSGMIVRVLGLSRASQVVLGDEAEDRNTQTASVDLGNFGIFYEDGVARQSRTAAIETVKLDNVPFFQEGSKTFSAVFMETRIEYLNNGLEAINFSLNQDTLTYGYDIQLRSAPQAGVEPTVYWSSAAMISWCAGLDPASFAASESYEPVTSYTEPNTLGAAITWSNLSDTRVRSCPLIDVVIQFTGRDMAAIQSKVAEVFARDNNDAEEGIQKPTRAQVVEAVLTEIPVIEPLNTSPATLELSIETSINEFLGAPTYRLPIQITSVPLTDLPR